MNMQVVADRVAGASGVRLLLDSVADGPANVAAFSPAAACLRREATALQRETVETYLDSGCRPGETCEKLFIHRTTLYYRLDNLPDVVREALDDGLSRSALHLCLKLMRHWEGSGLDSPR